MAVKMLMKGAILPGNSTVEIKDFEIPKPGYGQVLIKTKATTICGSDIRCIYREHTGKGPEGYIPGMVAGHEPCGQIVEEGEGLKRFKKGDRVIVYHISGCGVCNDCRRGYYISCKSKFRQAYGWQRNGGMAPYILADEKDLIELPDELTYKDGAQVACGFGTVYEAIEKIGVSGNDAVLVTGLGPVGLAALMLAKALGANKLIGVEMNDYRIDLAKKLGLNDIFLLNDEKIGRIGTLSCEKGLEEFLRDVIELLGCGGLRYCRGSGRVYRVAVGGGACGEYIPQAIAQGCDTFVTSDLRYNDFLDTRGLNLIDAGHFPTENVVCPAVKAYLEEHFPEVKTVISTSHRDVIQYYL